MNSAPPNPGGWLESFRRISESRLALLRSRFELFTVEWQEEKLRLLNLWVWLMIAAALGFAGIMVAFAALAIWLWSAAGYLGLILLALAAIGFAAAILFWSRHKIQTGPAPFEQTVAECRKDAECLKQND